MTLVDELKSESDTYWDPDVFDDIGRWVIQEQTLLLDYRDRFENLHQKMRVTQAREDAQSA
ncbi:MAG: hypothetical protein J2P37_09225 [Ktedonobacteraceae bacterium]|nr:hypothetical protein [Ktedonobacteraceae bacterium]